MADAPVADAPVADAPVAGGSGAGPAVRRRRGHGGVQPWHGLTYVFTLVAGILVVTGEDQT